MPWKKFGNSNKNKIQLKQACDKKERNKRNRTKSSFKKLSINEYKYKRNRDSCVLKETKAIQRTKK